MADRRMSSYEAKAWAELEAQLRKRIEKNSRVPKALRDKARAGADRVKDAFDKVPFSDEAEAMFGSAIAGLKTTTMDPALASIKRSGVVRDYQARQYEVDKLEDIRNLDLEAIDDVRPPLKLIYELAAGAEGATAALLITGAQVSTTVAGAPGAMLVIGALAGDAAAMLAATARAVAHIGAYYGYDTRKPEEELFALAAMNFSFSSGGEQASKAFAFRQLSVVTQKMARRATWEALNESILVRVINTMFKSLGFKLTKKKLSQAIPVLGVALGAGMNIQLLHRMAHDAEFAYRVRFLVEKHGIEPDGLLGTWYKGPPSGGCPPVGDVIDVEAIVHQELESDALS